VGAVSDPTSAPSAVDRRPAGVGTLIAIAWLAAAAWAVSAAVSLWRMLGGGPDVLLGGPSWFFWLVNAAMAALMAVLIGWIARGLARRDDGARVLFAAVAAISLVFSFLSLSFGVGLLTLVLSAVALVLATSKRTRAWFGH
jgi:hypothetical protein